MEAVQLSLLRATWQVSSLEQRHRNIVTQTNKLTTVQAKTQHIPGEDFLFVCPRQSTLGIDLLPITLLLLCLLFFILWHYKQVSPHIFSGPGLGVFIIALFRCPAPFCKSGN